MRIHRMARLTAALAVMVPFGWQASTVQADVTFFIQREGSPSDDGLARFLQAVGTAQEEDFEGPGFAPDGTAVRQLRFGKTKLKLERPLEQPLLPFTFSSEEFDAPGRFFGRGLVCGLALRITARGKELPRGLGMWVFDDMRAFDSAYLIEVTEKNGTRWQAVLENQIVQNVHGHEIEGFIGAVSDLGIKAMTIIPINPLTSAVQPDLFETDHWLVAGNPSSMNDDDEAEDDGEHHGKHGEKDEASEEDESHDHEEHASAAGTTGNRGSVSGCYMTQTAFVWRRDLARMVAIQVLRPSSRRSTSRCPARNSAARRA